MSQQSAVEVVLSVKDGFRQVDPYFSSTSISSVVGASFSDAGAAAPKPAVLSSKNLTVSAYLQVSGRY